MPKRQHSLWRSAASHFFLFLVAYWLIFIGCSTQKLFTGGIDGLLAWYEHITLEGTDLDFALARMDWTHFILNQAALLTATIVTGIISLRGKLPGR